MGQGIKLGTDARAAIQQAANELRGATDAAYEAVKRAQSIPKPDSESSEQIARNYTNAQTAIAELNSLMTAWSGTEEKFTSLLGLADLAIGETTKVKNNL